MEPDIAPDPEKTTYLVKSWEVRLKGGSVAVFNIREDKGESYALEIPWMIWRFPALKKESKILASEVAAIDYEEIERKELKAYKPKKGPYAPTQEIVATGISAKSFITSGDTAYIPRTKRDEEVG